MKQLSAIAIHFLSEIFVLLFFFSFFAAGCGQILHYLRYGDWLSISALDLLIAMGLKWAISPTDFMGIFRVLDWLPLSLFSFLVLMFLLYLKSTFFEDEYQVGIGKAKKLSYPKIEKILLVCLFVFLFWVGGQFFNKHQNEFHKEAADGLKIEEPLSGFK